MGTSQARRRALDAVGMGSDGGITPLGTAKVQEKGGSKYALLPSNLVQAHQISAGEELALGYHAPTNTLLVTPAKDVEDDHWAENQV